MNVKLSICCITYNHENFIEKALEGFLMQITNFDYEIIVVDDASTDGTSFIIEKYKDIYQEKIKYIRNAENIGVMANFIKALQLCEGEYIAICEGDDYWTNSNKLQKQVDFLDNESQYVACCHLVETDTQVVKLRETDGDIPNCTFFKFNPVTTLSVVFRNHIKSSNIQWIKECYIGDWPLHLINIQFGKYYYFAESMGYYRKNPNGLFTKMTRISFQEKVLKSLEKANENLGYFINGRLDQTITNYNLELFKLRFNFFFYFLKSLKLHKKQNSLNLGAVVNLIRFYFNV